MTWILGVDGGGTKTKAVAATPDGRVLGEAVATSSNHHTVGLAAAVAAIARAVDDAAKSTSGPPAAACFGLAGMDRARDVETMTAALAATGRYGAFEVLNDSELVLAAGTPDGVGVALLCGTGSICLGRGVGGESARAGGWGWLLGDEGSGYSLGVHALRLCTQTADGRTDAHRLLRAVLDAWQLEEPEQLLGRVYRPETTHADVASLAAVVMRAAKEGDAHAERLVQRAALALARLVESVAKRLSLVEPPLAFGGGLLTKSDDLKHEVLAKLRIDVGPATTVQDPSTGAIARARRSYAARSPPT